MDENKNLIVAVILCVVILFGWEFFVVGPRIDEEQARQEALQAESSQEMSSIPTVSEPGGTPAPGTMAPSIPGASTGVALSRQQALSKTRRVQIDTPRLRGSVSLKGARIDDLSFKDYRETLDAGSNEITLLSPEGAQDAYFAEFGWTQSGSNAALPGSSTMWSVETSGALSPTNPLRLSWDNGAGLRFTRLIEVDQNFLFTVTQEVENYGSTPVTLYPYGLVKRIGTPETENFFILHEGMLGVFDKTLLEIGYDDIQEEKEQSESSTGGWIGITDKYWMTALAPDQTQEFKGGFSDNVRGATDIYQVDYLLGGVVVAPGTKGSSENSFFAGAKEVGVMEAYAEERGIQRFDLAIDWGWLYFLTKPFFKALSFFGGLMGNFGLSIIMLTILIKLALFPIANKSYVAMSKMKKLQPEMVKLRDRYAEDKVKQQQEIMELYKREKVNPLAGCWPMLVQIPVFFALYKVLFITIEMRHAPFYGWIKDLSAPDPTSIFNLFGLIPWTPPDFLMLGIWPLIMGVSMFVQTKMNPAPADPVQEKVFLFMPLFFTFLLAQFPAGLVIYWALNNVLSIAQQYVIMTRQGVEVELLDRLGLKKLFGQTSTASEKSSSDKES